MLKVLEDGTGCKRQRKRGREGREQGRGEEEKRPEPNWLVMLDMPVTRFTWTAPGLPPSLSLPHSDNQQTQFDSLSLPLLPQYKHTVGDSSPQAVSSLNSLSF